LRLGFKQTIADIFIIGREGLKEDKILNYNFSITKKSKVTFEEEKQLFSNFALS
jgi:hypothetical protein